MNGLFGDAKEISLTVCGGIEMANGSLSHTLRDDVVKLEIDNLSSCVCFSSCLLRSCEQFNLHFHNIKCIKLHSTLGGHSMSCVQNFDGNFQKSHHTTWRCFLFFPIH